MTTVGSLFRATEETSLRESFLNEPRTSTTAAESADLKSESGPESSWKLKIHCMRQSKFAVSVEEKAVEAKASAAATAGAAAQHQRPSSFLALILKEIRNKVGTEIIRTFIFQNCRIFYATYCRHR